MLGLTTTYAIQSCCCCCCSCASGLVFGAPLSPQGAGKPEDHFIIPPVFIGALDAFVFLRDNKAFENETHKILAKTVGGVGGQQGAERGWATRGGARDGRFALPAAAIRKP